MFGGGGHLLLTFTLNSTTARIFLKMFTVNLFALLFLIEAGNYANTFQVLSYSYQEEGISLWLS